MKRAEAQKLIGTTVHGWTALKGEYLGELVGLTEARPWRGLVRIQAVLAYPTQGLAGGGGGWRERRPFAEGEVHEFGHCSITPYAGEALTYAESLRRVLPGRVAALERTIETETRMYGRTSILLEKELEAVRRHLAELDHEAPS